MELNVGQQKNKWHADMGRWECRGSSNRRENRGIRRNLKAATTEENQGMSI